MREKIVVSVLYLFHSCVHGTVHWDRYIIVYNILIRMYKHNKFTDSQVIQFVGPQKNCSASASPQ